MTWAQGYAGNEEEDGGQVHKSMTFCTGGSGTQSSGCSLGGDGGGKTRSVRLMRYLTAPGHQSE